MQFSLISCKLCPFSSYFFKLPWQISDIFVVNICYYCLKLQLSPSKQTSSSFLWMMWRVWMMLLQPRGGSRSLTALFNWAELIYTRCKETGCGCIMKQRGTERNGEEQWGAERNADWKVKELSDRHSWGEKFTEINSCCKFHVIELKLVGKKISSGVKCFVYLAK